MHVLYLAEITAWDPKIQNTRVLRFSDGDGYATSPLTVPANTYYEPKLLQPASIRRHLFTLGATMGRSVVGFGDLILHNQDGEFDFVLDLALDGRNVTIRRSMEYAPRYPEEFEVTLVGTMDQPEFSRDNITIRLRDRQADLDVALQPVKYAGNNVLPDGLEGLPSDLMGKPKPICYGRVYNIDPPNVNTARLIYQVNDGAVFDIPKVYDRAVELTRGADYIDVADMMANDPAPGTYRCLLTDGYFRLGSTPAGIITADVVQGDDATLRTAARIYESLIARARLVNTWTQNLAKTNLSTNDGIHLVTDTGAELISTGDISQTDLTTLDSTNPAELGYWTKEETTVAAVCDLVASTVGAWWGVDREGVFRIAQFVAPKHGEAKIVLRPDDMLRPLERLPTNDPGKGLPVYRQVLRWGRHYVKQTTDIAASVAQARRAELANEWRTVVATDPAVQERHLLSPEVIRDSLYAFEADAQAEANRRLALYSPRRDRYEITVHLNEETDRIDLGDTVNISHPRYGLNIAGSDDGVPFVVLGLEPDTRNKTLAINLWGSSTGLENFVTSDGELFMTDTGVLLTTMAA